eukprot:4950824-Karenia_brevis.AAC.1
MRQRGAKLEKINPRMKYGIFVGVNRKSNQFLIADEDGIRRVRSIRRIPKEQKWGEDSLKWIKWAPWK